MTALDEPQYRIQTQRKTWIIHRRGSVLKSNITWPPKSWLKIVRGAITTKNVVKSGKSPKGWGEGALI